MRVSTLKVLLREMRTGVSQALYDAISNEVQDKFGQPVLELFQSFVTQTGNEYFLSTQNLLNLNNATINRTVAIKDLLPDG